MSNGPYGRGLCSMLKFGKRQLWLEVFISMDGWDDKRRTPIEDELCDIIDLASLAREKLLSGTLTTADLTRLHWAVGNLLLHSRFSNLAPGNEDLESSPDPGQLAVIKPDDGIE